MPLASKGRAPQLYDTLTRTLKSLQPEDGKTYRMYCCGPTVYGPSHIGHFRTFILQDVLRRVLEVSGMKVLHVRNLTDIDDKTIRQSRTEGISLRQLSDKWTNLFQKDCRTLNLLNPHEEPRATDHIQQQIDLISQLIENKNAYKAADGSVYYRVQSFEDYGRLSGLDRRELQTQKTTSGGTANLADEYDRDSVADFALWKARKTEDEDNFWPSPWGEGRPGWHIECSAMSMNYLGKTLDLHGGGIDLCFPHHENEIAQSEGATGKPFAHHWFHSAHLMVDGTKMSKSLGNLYTLDDLIKKGHSPMAIRYALLSAHYRQQLNFTDNTLNAARSALEKLEKTIDPLLKKQGKNKLEFENLHRDKVAAQFGSWGIAWNHLTNDLNTPKCLGHVFKTINELDAKGLSLELPGLSRLLYVLGLKLFTEEKKESEIPEDVRRLADERLAARQAGDWVKSDKLRDQIKSKGWQILDSKDGYILKN